VDIESGQSGGHQNGEEDTQKGQVDMSSPGGQSVDTKVDMDGKARTQAYRAAHPEATYKEIANALHISQKTVQRHIGGQVDTQKGHQIEEVDTSGGHQADGEDTESGQQASEMDEPIDIRRKKIRVVR
jgi:predicted transcriptional regulator